MSDILGEGKVTVMFPDMEKNCVMNYLTYCYTGRLPKEKAEQKELDYFIKSLWGGSAVNQMATDTVNTERVSSDVHGYLKSSKTVKVLLPQSKREKLEVPDNVECRMCHKIIKVRLCSLKTVFYSIYVFVKTGKRGGGAQKNW